MIHNKLSLSIATGLQQSLKVRTIALYKLFRTLIPIVFNACKVISSSFPHSFLQIVSAVRTCANSILRSEV
jgi:hypothetical protein